MASTSVSGPEALVIPATPGIQYGVESDKECPFSILLLNDEESLFLIREKDKYGEYPNIYARMVSETTKSAAFDVSKAKFIVLCDTGCGTNISLQAHPARFDPHGRWNIGSFLEATINPKERLPYLIIMSHCHYDHILGIANLPKSTVLSSAYQKSFITPRSHLAEHSLCNDLGILVPDYRVDIWAEDFQELVLKPAGSQSIPTGITILQTPGHTPDSLSWYDSTLSPPHIFVGDTLYERQSTITRHEREPPMPTVFNVDSNLADWSKSIEKMIKFVRERNLELGTTASEAEDDWVLVSQPKIRRYDQPRVMLGAAHVTVAVDAEKCLEEMRDFMNRILQDRVAHCRVNDEKGHEVWLWDDLLDWETAVYAHQWSVAVGRFSVRAPLFVVEKERERLREQISNSKWNRSRGRAQYC
jgi:glyoxylase-like metal-dependent hydrolase (beta-lactamase superfamily II)